MYTDDTLTYYPLCDNSLVLCPYRVISTQNSIEDGIVVKEEDACSDQEKSSLELVVPPKTDDHQIHESNSLISFEDESASPSEVIGQPSPPPVLADVQDLIPASTPATQTESAVVNASDDALVCSEDPLQLHIVMSFILFSAII